jgi:hypothetical protein
MISDSVYSVVLYVVMQNTNTCLRRKGMTWVGIPRARLISSLDVEGTSSSETSVNFYQTKRRNIPEDSGLHGNKPSAFIKGWIFWTA